MIYRAAVENIGTVATNVSLYEAMKAACRAGGYVVRQESRTVVAFYAAEAKLLRPAFRASPEERETIEQNAEFLAGTVA